MTFMTAIWLLTFWFTRIFLHTAVTISTVVSFALVGAPWYTEAIPVGVLIAHLGLYTWYQIARARNLAIDAYEAYLRWQWDDYYQRLAVGNRQQHLNTPA